MTRTGFSKTPVSSMLARGSPSHDQHGGNRHGLSGYVAPRPDAIRPHARPPLRSPPPAGPTAPARPATGARGSGPRQDSSRRGVGSATSGQPQVPLPTGRHRPRRAERRVRAQTVDQEVLFYLPVTRAWLRQLILALVLIC